MLLAPRVFILIFRDPNNGKICPKYIWPFIPILIFFIIFIRLIQELLTKSKHILSAKYYLVLCHFHFQVVHRLLNGKQNF